MAYARYKKIQRAVRVLQFKITLLGIKPRIWRRIQVAENYNFWEFHAAIQDAMGWYDTHLHEFEIINPRTFEEELIGSPEYGQICPDSMWPAFFGETRKRISGANRKVTRYFFRPRIYAIYKYDFGDRWEHKVVLEKVLPLKMGARYPRCVAGERSCPPEDVGGIPGYNNLLKIICNPKHKEYKEMWDWLKNGRTGFGDFDPEKFDATNVEFSDPTMRFLMDNLLKFV